MSRELHVIIFANLTAEKKNLGHETAHDSPYRLASTVLQHRASGVWVTDQFSKIERTKLVSPEKLVQFGPRFFSCQLAMFFLGFSERYRKLHIFPFIIHLRHFQLCT